MLRQQIGHAIAAQGFASGIGKHRFLRACQLFALPCLQGAYGILTQWGAPRFAAFTLAPYMKLPDQR